VTSPRQPRPSAPGARPAPAGTPGRTGLPGRLRPAPSGPAIRRPGAFPLIIAAGVVTAVGIGVYGRLHPPAATVLDVAGFSSGAAAKAWLTTLATLLALVQVASALVLTGRLGGRVPPWTAPLHRWSGRAAVVVTLPVAVHCLYALGFQTGSLRVLVHGIAGCAFYGVFVAKMLALPRRDVPGRTVPVLGAALAAALAALFATAAAWFFVTSGVHF
jgi:Family of unknown function (DUF6529)